LPLKVRPHLSESELPQATEVKGITVLVYFFLLIYVGYSSSSSSSSSVGATACCGLWPIEQYLSIFPYLSPTLSIFSLPALEDLFLLLSILSWVFLFQFLSEDLFGNPILLRSPQVVQPTYPLPLYPFYYIFSFSQLF
jgi:hypothetical protein